MGFLCTTVCDMHHDDYVAQDNDGHEYRFQICGTAKQQCLPADYDPTYNGGVAIQLWVRPKARRAILCL